MNDYKQIGLNQNQNFGPQGHEKYMGSNFQYFLVQGLDSHVLAWSQNLRCGILGNEYDWKSGEARLLLPSSPPGSFSFGSHIGFVCCWEPPNRRGFLPHSCVSLCLLGSAGTDWRPSPTYPLL